MRGRFCGLKTRRSFQPPGSVPVDKHAKQPLHVFLILFRLLFFYYYFLIRNYSLSFQQSACVHLEILASTAHCLRSNQTNHTTPFLDYLDSMAGDWEIEDEFSYHISRHGMVLLTHTNTELHYHPSDNQEVK